ncbi:hypothetical protein F5887DRAFT_920883 [Amanita rubescens]|nr:hypothetical protein F5887DRAFT_920883 [Amanita rubescens]
MDTRTIVGSSGTSLRLILINLDSSLRISKRRDIAVTSSSSSSRPRRHVTSNSRKLGRQTPSSICVICFTRKEPRPATAVWMQSSSTLESSIIRRGNSSPRYTLDANPPRDVPIKALRSIPGFQEDILGLQATGGRRGGKSTCRDHGPRRPGPRVAPRRFLFAVNISVYLDFRQLQPRKHPSFRPSKVKFDKARRGDGYAPANLSYSPREFAETRVIIQNVERDRFIAEEPKYFAENFGGCRFGVYVCEGGYRETRKAAKESVTSGLAVLSHICSFHVNKPLKQRVVRLQENVCRVKMRDICYRIRLWEARQLLVAAIQCIQGCSPRRKACKMGIPGEADKVQPSFFDRVVELQQRTHQLQPELERTKKELCLTKEELESNRVFGNKADIVSETDIITKVKSLNDCQQCVYQWRLRLQMHI